jgi:hypothetical protein
VAQSTTRVTKVREAKHLMEAQHEDFKRMDYWLVFRDAVIDRVMGEINSRGIQRSDRKSDRSKGDRELS